eukprot:CAMPEP_0115701074 /NCGR_PEP_ID=MMETSP0272-20121206/67758_1 /TAXON_ID=71861 /ORGANISM="Scrippsiella trochoidea, Strain CCMP3099" /LENGTH=177 /DNA_ID=CAMNT_0003141621 /DNA_START=170 /DNA_END=700 /DNA_ORIENTATION=+
MSNMALLVYGPPPLPCLLVKSFARRCPVLIRGRNGPAVFEVVGDLVPLEIAAIWGAGPRPVPALAQAEPPQQISLVSSASAGERWRRAAASWARLQTGCGTPSEALKHLLAGHLQQLVRARCLCGFALRASSLVGVHRSDERIPSLRKANRIEEYCVLVGCLISTSDMLRKWHNLSA